MEVDTLVVCNHMMLDSMSNSIYQYMHYIQKEYAYFQTSLGLILGQNVSDNVATSHVNLKALYSVSNDVEAYKTYLQNSS